MKKLNLVLFVVLLLIAGACKRNTAESAEPGYLKNIRQLVSEKYPDYTGINVRALDEDRVYLADFKSQGQAYSVITNESGILQVARVNGGEVSGALSEKVNTLNIRGGTFSNYTYNTAVGSDGVERSYHLANYRLNGVDYVLQADQELRRVTLELHYDNKYTTTSLSDLPAQVQAFVRARMKPNPVLIQATKLNDMMKDYLSPRAELTFAKAVVYIMPGGQKLYNVNAYYFGIPMFEFWFNGSGGLLLTGSCDKLQKFEKTIEPMDNPQLRNTNLSATDLSFFSGNFNRNVLGDLALDTSSDTWQAEYNQVKSYNILYRKNDGKTDVHWAFGLDISKNVIYSYYDSYLNQ